MKHYMRVCAEINLDAVAYNFKSMKDNLTPGTKMVAVVKTDGYGHGAVQIAQMVEALADPIRREILNLLKNGPLSAGEIVDHFSVTGASISRHLSVLKEADLIRDRREGKFIYYELNASVLEEIMLWITDLKGESDHDGND